MEDLNCDACKIRTGITAKELEENYGITAVEGNGVTSLIFTIHSYMQYSALISILNKNASPNKIMFYRGVKDSSFELKSSLQVSGLQSYESQLIRDTYNSFPSEFQNCKTDFEMIAKMRHYGLPTRFIDFTRNPDIALWFACEHSDKDGMIYIIISNNNTLHERMANIISKIAVNDLCFKSGLDFEYIYNFIGVSDLKYYIENMWTFGKSMFFEPPKIDQREINQQSVFLAECSEVYHVFWNEKGQQREDIDEKNFRSFINAHFKNIPKDLLDDHLVFGVLKDVFSYPHYDECRIIIPDNVKEEILRELDYRCINKAFIYPTIGNSIEVITERYKKLDKFN